MASYIPLEGLYLAKPLVPGKFAREHPMNYVRSFAAGESIPMGFAVQVSGDDPGICRKAYSNRAMVLGVAMFSPDTHETDYTTPAYLSGSAVGVGEGLIMVRCWEAVEVGDAVRMRITTSSSYLAGMFGKTSDTYKTVLLDPACAEWRTASASGVNETGLIAELFIKTPIVIETVD